MLGDPYGWKYVILYLNFRMSEVTFVHVCMRAIKKLFLICMYNNGTWYIPTNTISYIAFSIQLSTGLTQKILFV